MSNRQELDKLVMTDPVAYAVYNKSKIDEQTFEQFLISLVLTQHDGLNKVNERIAELERKLEEANEISKMRFDRMEELSEALVEESDKYEEQLAERDALLRDGIGLVTGVSYRSSAETIKSYNWLVKTKEVLDE